MVDTKKHQRASSWNGLKKKHFVTLLKLHTDSLNEAQNGKRKGWSAEAWAKISEGMHTKYPALNFSMKQLKQLERHLRKLYGLIKEIEKQPGFGFDKDKCRIVASNDNWTNLLKNNPKARRFRTRPLPYYDGLEVLYNEGSSEPNSIEPTAIEQDGKNEESSKPVEQTSTQDDKNENSTLNERITTTQQHGKNERSSEQSGPITTTQQDAKNEEDFSIERCIAEYSELPAELRKKFDFKQICKIFENEPLRYYFLSIPRSNIDFRQGLLNANITNFTIKKDGKNEENFSIERCIAEYYELPAAMRENFDFKQILEIFENKPMRYYFMSIPKSNIEFRQGLLSANITNYMRKKDGKNEERSKQTEPITSTQNDKNEESSNRQSEPTATQDGKNEEDFSIERCIAEYYELPVEMRKIFYFKQIVEIFENERLRKYFISIAKSNIDLRQNFLKLGVNIIDYMKTKGLLTEKNKLHQPDLQPYQKLQQIQQPYQQLQHQPHQQLQQIQQPYQPYQQYQQIQQPYQPYQQYQQHMTHQQHQIMQQIQQLRQMVLPRSSTTFVRGIVPMMSGVHATIPTTSLAVPTVPAVPATPVEVPNVPAAPTTVPVTSLAVPNVPAAPPTVPATSLAVPNVPAAPATECTSAPTTVPAPSVAVQNVPAAPEQ